MAQLLPHSFGPEYLAEMTKAAKTIRKIAGTDADQRPRWCWARG